MFISAIVPRTGGVFFHSWFFGGMGAVEWWCLGFFLTILSFLSKGNTVENASKVAVEDWSEDDVSAWLCAQDLADFVGLFKRNNIDGKELLNLTKESLINELKIGKSTGMQIVLNL